MNKKTKNKMKMYKSVDQVCTNNQTSWSMVPAFTNYFNLFKTKLVELEQFASKQALTLKGVRAQRDILRKETIDLAMILVPALKMFAKVSNNNEILEKVNVSDSELRRADFLTLTILLGQIEEMAVNNIAALEDFGIDSQVIQNFMDAKENLLQDLNSPRLAIIDRKRFTSAIDTITREIDDLLNHYLDQMVQVIKAADQEFFLKYTNARVIIDHRGRPKPERDDGNDNFISG